MAWPDRQLGWDHVEAGKISLPALAWISGFLEGEGSFIGHKASISVAAVQVQREPLERLHLALGGSVKPYVNNHGRMYYRWTIHGSHAVGVAFTVYTLMSPRRREQIRNMVAMWKRRPGRNNTLKIRCPRGHEYTPDNIYITKVRSRSCRECHATYYGKQVINGSAPEPLDPGGTPGE